MKISITQVQRKALENLWFIYGNNGAKCTSANHHFIQGILERGSDERAAYLNATYEPLVKLGKDLTKIRITQECVDAVDQVLNLEGK